MISNQIRTAGARPLRSLASIASRSPNNVLLCSLSTQPPADEADGESAGKTFGRVRLDIPVTPLSFHSDNSDNQDTPSHHSAKHDKNGNADVIPSESGLDFDDDFDDKLMDGEYEESESGIIQENEFRLDVDQRNRLMDQSFSNMIDRINEVADELEKEGDSDQDGEGGNDSSEEIDSFLAPSNTSPSTQPTRKPKVKMAYSNSNANNFRYKYLSNSDGFPRYQYPLADNWTASTIGGKTKDGKLKKASSIQLEQEAKRQAELFRKKKLKGQFPKDIDYSLSDAEKKLNIMYNEVPRNNPNQLKKNRYKSYIPPEQFPFKPPKGDESPRSYQIYLGSGKLAPLCTESVVGCSGDTTVFCNITLVKSDPDSDSESGADDADDKNTSIITDGQLPFTVDYRERYHASGRIPLGMNKRDNLAPSESETLASRVVDRVLRPLIPAEHFSPNDELAITCSVQSYDRMNLSERKDYKRIEGDPVCLAVNAASAALLKNKDIPFDGPAAAVKVMLDRNDKIILDPTFEELKNAKLEMLYAGNDTCCLMLEFGALGREPGIPEHQVATLMRFAHRSLQPLLDVQRKFAGIGRNKSGKRSNKAAATKGGDTGLAAAAANDDVVFETELGSFLAANLDASVDSESESESDFGFSRDHDSHDSHESHDSHDSSSSDLEKDLFNKAFEETQEQFGDMAITIFNPSNDAIDLDTLRSKRYRAKQEGELKSLVSHFLASSHQDAPNHGSIFELLMKNAMRESALRHGARQDRRNLNEVRPISGAAPCLPPSVHGSAFFARGETQVMSTVTLGSPLDTMDKRNPFAPTVASQLENKQFRRNILPIGSIRSQTDANLINNAEEWRNQVNSDLTAKFGSFNEDDKRQAFLHYDFPAYSVGEVPSGGGASANRRSIGHGMLAEKAILPVLPLPCFFPYSIRMTSEVMSSNGSSSMASVCGATMSLLDAGVILEQPVAGISVGLVTKTEAEIVDDKDGFSHFANDDDYKLLLDITGTEDHYGDMDFKVAGTVKGITAMQLDVKLSGGIPVETLIDGLSLARQGRKSVLCDMAKGMSGMSGMSGSDGPDGKGSLIGLAQNRSLKFTAPRCEIIRFDPNRKQSLIGQGGNIKKLLEDRFDVALDLTQDGQAIIFGENEKKLKRAKMAVMELVSDVEVGGVYDGVITEIKDFGAVVEVLRNKEGILHMSEITNNPELVTKSQKGNVGVVKDLLAVGQRVELLCTGVDRVRGQIKFSRSKLVEKQMRENEIPGYPTAKGKQNDNSKGGRTVDSKDSDKEGRSSSVNHSNLRAFRDHHLEEGRKLALAKAKEEEANAAKFALRRDRTSKKFNKDFFKDYKAWTNDNRDIVWGKDKATKAGRRGGGGGGGGGSRRK